MVFQYKFGRDLPPSPPWGLAWQTVVAPAPQTHPPRPSDPARTVRPPAPEAVALGPARDKVSTVSVQSGAGVMRAPPRHTSADPPPSSCPRNPGTRHCRAPTHRFGSPGHSTRTRLAPAGARVSVWPSVAAHSCAGFVGRRETTATRPAWSGDRVAAAAYVQRAFPASAPKELAPRRRAASHTGSHGGPPLSPGGPPHGEHDGSSGSCRGPPTTRAEGSRVS